MLRDLNNNLILLAGGGRHYYWEDRDFKIIAPLDEYAVGTCAKIRAHLACPGLCEGTTRKVRDKLTMRCVAESHGIPIPAYCGFNNKKQISKLLSSTSRLKESSFLTQEFSKMWSVLKKERNAELIRVLQNVRWNQLAIISRKQLLAISANWLL